MAEVPNSTGAVTDPPARKPYSAGNLEMHCWGQSSIANVMLYFPIAMTNFLVVEYKFSPILIGWAFFIPRIFDGLLDPMIGHLSDITHTRWGRRRPFILGTALLGSFMIIAIWWMSPDWGQWFVTHAPAGPPWLAQWWATRDWSQTAMFAWLAVCITVLFTCFGTYEMTCNALGYELSDDYNVRTKVFAIYNFWYTLGNTALSFVWPMTLALFASAIIGIRVISLGMAALTIISALIVFFGTKERFAKANKTHVKIWPALKATLRVKAFVIVLLMGVSNNIIIGIWNAVAFYIAALYVFEGDYDKYNRLCGIGLMLIGLVVSFLLMPSAARITRHIGKRRGIILCSALSLLNAIVLFLIARPGYQYLWFAWAALFIPINSIGGLFGSSLMPDICDIDELQSGERREALFSAVNTFFGKLLRSGMVLLSGYLVVMCGYDKELQSHQLPETLHTMIWVGFPALILGSAVGLVIACFMPLTPEYMAKVHAELEARRRSGQAQEGLAE